MSRLPLALRELHRAETGLARDLLAVADRHPHEHEIVHVARDIARWSRIHIRRLAEVGRDQGVRLDPEPRWEVPLLTRFTQRLATGFRGRLGTGVRLLADLRRLHRKAAGVSLDWELLAQAAQAMKQRELLDLAQSCHPQTLRQMRWTNAQLKVRSPQVIAS